MKFSNAIFARSGGVAAALVLAAFLQVPAQAQETIKVGIFGGTGPFANLGEGFAVGAAPVIEAFNKKNSGVKIERVSVNVGSYDPTMGLNSIKKSIEVDNVLTMLGAGSPILLAARPFLEESKTVIFSTAEATALVKENNYLQQIVPLLGDEVNAAADYYCAKKSIKTIAVLAVNGAFGDTAVNTVEDRFTKCGIKVVSVQRYPVPTASFRPQLAAIKQAEPDAIYLGTIGTSENTAVVVQARQLGIKSQLIGYLASPEGALFDVDAGEGFVYTGFAIGDGLPAEIAAANTKIGPLVLYGYNFATVVTKVIEAAQASGAKITRETFRDTLLKVRKFETASGSFCFQEDGHTRLPLAVWEVKNKKPVQLQLVPSSRAC
ncbi:MAG: amino acid/amide transporter substrate-binding protein family [Alphaproteobacteria bacterium]|jgi:ABC-type branched-subunit amino acid transport system substrate-binding protein|nr:amino acid/amide transporter substrate-binding protein family [Alphaproteobacteria bacterium]